MLKYTIFLFALLLFFSCKQESNNANNNTTKTNNTEATNAPAAPAKLSYAMTPRAEGDTGVKQMPPDQDGFVLINIHPETAVELATSGTVQVLDVRTYDELIAEPRLYGARNFDFRKKDFKANLEKLDKNKPHLVYCRSGGRSAKACKMMKEAGIKSVYNMEGGYEAYKRLGLLDLH